MTEGSTAATAQVNLTLPVLRQGAGPLVGKNTWKALLEQWMTLEPPD